MTDAEWDRSVYGWEPRRSQDAHGVEISDLRLANSAGGADQSARWPAEPPVGTVLKFEKQFEPFDRIYTYVAVRLNKTYSPWFLSGNRIAKSWAELREFIGDVDWCSIATDWFDVPPVVVVDQDIGPTDPSEYVGRCWPAHTDAKILYDRPWED